MGGWIPHKHMGIPGHEQIRIRRNRDHLTDLAIGLLALWPSRPCKTSPWSRRPGQQTAGIRGARSGISRCVPSSAERRTIGQHGGDPVLPGRARPGVRFPDLRVPHDGVVPPLTVDEPDELRALHRMLFKRKFDGPEDEFFGSPFIASVQRKLFKALKDPRRGPSTRRSGRGGPMQPSRCKKWRRCAPTSPVLVGGGSRPPTPTDAGT